MSRPSVQVITPAALDSILNGAVEGFGFRIRCTNARRLAIMLRARISEHQKSHPEAFKSLSIQASRSPLEVYIINREAAHAYRKTSASTDGEAPD